jgi:hypothetical protein
MKILIYSIAMGWVLNTFFYFKEKNEFYQKENLTPICSRCFILTILGVLFLPYLVGGAFYKFWQILTNFVCFVHFQWVVGFLVATTTATKVILGRG